MFIKMNGKTLPTPAHGLNETWTQFVDSGRNAKAEVVAQKIGRRQLKLDGVVFPYLTASQWASVLTEIEKFKGTLTYWDSRSGAMKNYTVYWGDASAEVFKTNPKTGEILSYINCQCNIIDMGL
jgi:hypothetical protein